MAVAVAIHLVGGLAVILYLRPRMDAQACHPLLHALGLVIQIFAALLLLHLTQVGLWALLYWWQIGWDLNTALYHHGKTPALPGDPSSLTFPALDDDPFGALVDVMQCLEGATARFSSISSFRFSRLTVVFQPVLTDCE